MNLFAGGLSLTNKKWRKLQLFIREQLLKCSAMHLQENSYKYKEVIYSQWE